MDAICNELLSQLELWYSSIPETFRPDLEVDTTDITNRQSILRIRYFATRHIIFRPFLLSIVIHDSERAPASMLEKAVLCIESCRYYIYHTTHVLARPSQYTWTFSLSYDPKILSIQHVANTNLTQISWCNHYSYASLIVSRFERLCNRYRRTSDYCYQQHSTLGIFES